MTVKDLLPILGPILASMIAGAIAFLTSVLSKESKTSEFRQHWIDSIRDDLSEFISAFYWITDADRHSDMVDETTLKSAAKEMKSEFIKIEQMQSRIELRLNPNEHKVLIERLHNLTGLNSFTRGDAASRDRAVREFVTESQAMLQKEWKRVKRGEAIFQITKWSSLVVLVTATAAAYLLLKGHLNIVWQP